MRILTENPLNAETPPERLRSWITANSVFFHRNQSELKERIALGEYRLSVEGRVETPCRLSFDEILALPKAIQANTIECSGNGRALLKEPASGNPWRTGGVGNAVWGGVWLREILSRARPQGKARHVAFEGLDEPAGRAKIKFIRSIPLEKAAGTTLLAYEMNGEPLPLEHGFPLRALALGWVGANCAKWLSKIILLEEPFEGHYMDRVYRVFQKGQDPKTGRPVTQIPLKSFFTQPLPGQRLRPGRNVLLGTAYGGERELAEVEISTDGGRSWEKGEWIGPREPFAWRQWQYAWETPGPGDFHLLVRVTASSGEVQPLRAAWNVLGYENNGVIEHALFVRVE
jgi:DMSO/TMAO reductase YedYZ molybdopterin-dependent catalytic subunit